MDSDGTGLIRFDAPLSFYDRFVKLAALSPGGRRVALLANFHFDQGLFVANADGSGEPTFIGESELPAPGVALGLEPGRQVTRLHLGPQ